MYIVRLKGEKYSLFYLQQKNRSDGVSEAQRLAVGVKSVWQRGSQTTMRTERIQ